MISNAGTTGTSLKGSYWAASSFARTADSSGPCSPSTPRAGVPGRP